MAAFLKRRTTRKSSVSEVRNWNSHLQTSQAGHGLCQSFNANCPVDLRHHLGARWPRPDFVAEPELGKASRKDGPKFYRETSGKVFWGVFQIKAPKKHLAVFEVVRSKSCMVPGTVCCRSCALSGHNGVSGGDQASFASYHTWCITQNGGWWIFCPAWDVTNLIFKMGLKPPRLCLKPGALQRLRRVDPPTATKMTQKQWDVHKNKVGKISYTGPPNRTIPWMKILNLFWTQPLQGNFSHCGPSEPAKSLRQPRVHSILAEVLKRRMRSKSQCFLLLNNLLKRLDLLTFFWKLCQSGWTGQRWSEIGYNVEQNPPCVSKGDGAPKDCHVKKNPRSMNSCHEQSYFGGRCHFFSIRQHPFFTSAWAMADFHEMTWSHLSPGLHAMNLDYDVVVYLEPLGSLEKVGRPKGSTKIHIVLILACFGPHPRV